MKTKATTSKRSWTLRIERIQIGKSSEDLWCDLTSIIKRDLLLNQDETTVKIDSIAQRDQKVACATATFQTSIPRNEMMKQLRKANPSLLYRFDDNFQGITPLYKAIGGADVE